MNEEFDIKNISGLSEQEAAVRLKKEGMNELPSQKGQNIFVILYNILKEPMLLLLLVSGLIYLILGEVKDALMLLLFVFVVIGITFYQERKTERALEALRNLSSPRALVIRGGEQKRIPGREVVREDILILREGDRVPADGVVLFCSNLMVDESLLTGESLAVRKTEWDGKKEVKQAGGEDFPFVFSGTLVVQGHGVVKVTSIGINTEMGKIGKALETIVEEETLLKKETTRLIRNFAIGGVILCVLVSVIYGLTRGHWLNGFLAGLSLSMAMLPEEFSVVLLIFLSLGAWRMSKRQVLTRRTQAIETLGSATVLCVDKTGTLTMNKMILSALFAGGEYYEAESRKNEPLPEKFHDLLEYAYLASQRDPFDPIEKEIRNSTEKYLLRTEHIHDNWKLVREYALSKNLLALSHVWESPDKQKYVIAAKGAPEAIADLCHLDDKEKNKLLDQVVIMANNGLRVLGVAQAEFDKTLLPDEQHMFDFKFVGIIGFVDPVRPTVKESLAECYSAGIRVIMVTGDYPGTARHIARQIGLRNPESNIFARVVPGQKLAIVNALKEKGEIVAMTGDGVNDSPALKSAHIGIAMGERGTDVAREASDIVLLNDDFSSIVQAVRMGRRIFDNLKKAMSYIFAVHVPIAGMALLPVLFKMPLVLLPAHIAFLELIIDPACSTVFEAEPEEKDIMNRPPRDLKKPLFDRGSLVISLSQGLSVLAVVFIVYLLSLLYGKSEDEARTLTFTTLVIANVLLIISNLSLNQLMIKKLFSNNIALRLVVIGAISSLGLVLYVPFLRSLFHFSIMHFDDLLVASFAGIISIFWFEILKLIRKF